MSDSIIRLRLTKKAIDALKPAEKRAIFWDSELPGFGLRIEETGRKTFIVRYRPGGGRKAPKRFLTLGRYGNLTPEEARVAARKILSAGNLGMDPAADRLRKRQELTVTELCDLYLDIGVEHGQACERFLNAQELAKLGAVLAKAEEEGANATAINIIRMLAMTGARRNEIAALLWDEVDFDHACLRLRDSKTGAKVIPLGGPALQLLSGLIRLRQSPFVFPASVGRGHFIGVKSTWDRVRREAGFPKLRLHDLRHSFASMGLAAGDTLPMIGALLGHSNPRTTSRYAHLADDPKRQAAQRISSRIADAMGLT